jgi:hypothetical protein
MVIEMPYLQQDLTIIDLDHDAVAWTNFCAAIPDEHFSTKGINKILKEQYRGIFSASHWKRTLRFDSAEDRMYFILIWS